MWQFYNIDFHYINGNLLKFNTVDNHYDWTETRVISFVCLMPYANT